MTRYLFIFITLMTTAEAMAETASPTASAFPVEKLPPGFVRGDVVSYSYVPNCYWGRAEAIGILPYLFEYGLMKHKDDYRPLETHHAENIRRIDMASQWSTCIQLYPRHDNYRDEIINLMIRCFKNRQLIILGESFDPDTKEPLKKVIAILDKLWENRDKTLANQEGDKATGRQLINNILMVNIGDENLGDLKTSGLEKMNNIFKEKIKDKLLDGQRPFAHIKTWFNEVHYGIGSYAANGEDVTKRRQKWPANSDFIGVDVYHWWGFDHSPFDPDDPKTTREQIIQHAVGWQNVITKYYGPAFRVTLGEKWDPRHKNDTHAMLQAIDLAGADRAMMLFIGTSDYLKEKSYTTPIETMDAYYDSVKAGPWVGLAWWIFDEYKEDIGTLAYLDKKLVHYTPQNRPGSPYSEQQLESYRRRFIESRKRMFNDVVYNQFGYLNGPPPRPRSDR